MVAGNIHCPSCNFPVQVEWNTCRRCGTRLPFALRESSSVPAPASALGVRRTVSSVSASPASPLPPNRSRAPGDTLLPGRTSPKAGLGPDTLLPAEDRPTTWTTGRKRAAAAAVVAIGVVVARLRRSR
jgi:hypothetical protein